MYMSLDDASHSHASQCDFWVTLIRSTAMWKLVLIVLNLIETWGHKLYFHNIINKELTIKTKVAQGQSSENISLYIFCIYNWQLIKLFKHMNEVRLHSDLQNLEYKNLSFILKKKFLNRNKDVFEVPVTHLNFFCIAFSLLQRHFYLHLYILVRKLSESLIVPVAQPQHGLTTVRGSLAHVQKLGQSSHLQKPPLHWSSWAFT